MSAASAYPDVQPQPNFPRIEERDRRALGARRHVPRVDRPARGRAGGADEFVFYDGPPFANGLPHYGHLLTGFVKDAVPRYRTMRGDASTAASAGTATACPPRSRPRRSSASPGTRRSRRTASAKFNDACRTSVLRYTDEWQRYVTRQARWVDFENDYKTLDLPTWRASCGRSRRCGTRVSSTRASACWPTAGAARRRSATPRRAWTTSTATARTRRSRSAFELLDGPCAGDAGAGLDDHAVDAAGEPRPRRRARHRLRGRRARRRSGTSSPRPPRRLRRRAGRTASAGSWHADRAPTWSAPATRPLFDFFADTERFGTERVPGARRRLRLHRGRHRRRPHGARLRRGRPGRLQRRRHPDARADGRARPLHRRGRAVGRRARVRRQPARHPPPQGRRRRRPPRDLRPLVPALLALRPAARLPGDLVVVRRGHQVPRPHGRAQRADHVGARAPQARQLRQVAAERPRLVDQPQPLLGLADPGVAQRRPELPARRRLRLARRARGRLRRRGHRPAPPGRSTTSCGPTPTTRPGAR